MAGSSGRGAAFVSAGIQLSRLAGLIRTSVFSYYFGLGPLATAFFAATRIPNFLQNLLGEGVLSASFIPVYTSLRARGRESEAAALANAVLGLLAGIVGLLVAAGLVWTPFFVDAIAPGLSTSTRELTIELVRIIFPGTGVLVLSAWCLGVLNSHRRFFLSYVAPVAWNLTIIGALVLWGRSESAPSLITIAAWATVAGSVLQFVVQLPLVFSLLRALNKEPATGPSASLKEVIAGFVPAFISRGVVQVSAYLDTAYATLLSERALAALVSAQTLSLFPISAFAMAISAAELPEMAEEATLEDSKRRELLRDRLTTALERMAFFMVPSTFALLALGDALAGLLFQHGRFTAADSRFAWYLLIGSSLGLWAQAAGRLYSSAFYALKDTRTPLRFSVIRVVLTAAAGAGAVMLARELRVPAEAATMALTLASGSLAWVEYALLRGALHRKAELAPVRIGSLGKVVIAAAMAAAATLAVKAFLTAQLGANPRVLEEWGGAVLAAPNLNAKWAGLIAVAIFALTYAAATYAMKVPLARQLVSRLTRRGSK